MLSMTRQRVTLLGVCPSIRKAEIHKSLKSNDLRDLSLNESSSFASKDLRRTKANTRTDS